MNKNELVSAISEKSGLTKKDVGLFVDTFTDVVVETLTNGDDVSLSGFGKFEVRTRAARNGVNPQTKEKITIESKKAPAFKAGKNFKDAVK